MEGRQARGLVRADNGQASGIHTAVKTAVVAAVVLHRLFASWAMDQDVENNAGKSVTVPGPMRCNVQLRRNHAKPFRMGGKTPGNLT